MFPHEKEGKKNRKRNNMTKKFVHREMIRKKSSVCLSVKVLIIK